MKPVVILNEVNIVALIVGVMVLIALGVLAFRRPGVVLGIVLPIALLGFLVIGYTSLDVQQEATVVEQHVFEQQQRESAARARLEAEILNRETLPEAPAVKVAPSSSAADDEATPASVAPDLSIPTSIREVIHSPNRGATAENDLEELPDWVREPNLRTRAGDRIDLTLGSQRFATLEEARDQLWSRLAEEIRRHQSDQYPEMEHWTPDSDETLKAGVLQRECIVTWPLEAGGFTVDVYQLHWDVQLNPETRSHLYAAWKPHEVQRRLLHLGSALGGVTLLLGTGAFVFRRRRAHTA